MSKDYNNSLNIRWEGMKQFLLLLMVVVLFSCGSGKSESENPEATIIQTFLGDNTLTAALTAEGVYQYPIIENASGNSAGDVYSIYYTLSNLETDEVIDSHLLADGDPIKLQYGTGAIFPLGLDYGLNGIKEGEIYGIIIPNALAYGVYTSASVPAGTILHFEVEVAARESESNIATAQTTAIENYITVNDIDNTVTSPIDAVVELSDDVYYKRTQIGTGAAPASGDSITIDYTGRLLNEASFDDLTNFKYEFGTSGVISGMELGIAEMDEGEMATIFIPSAQAYGASVRVIPESASAELITQLVIPAYAEKVKPYEVLIFDVTLKTVH